MTNIILINTNSYSLFIHYLFIVFIDIIQACVYSQYSGPTERADVDTMWHVGIYLFCQTIFINLFEVLNGFVFMVSRWIKRII